MGMELSKLYQRRWMAAAVSVWLGALVIEALALPFVGFDAGWLFVPEALHHLGFLSPFLAWEVARQAVRESTIQSRDGGWMLSRPLSCWPLWFFLGYTAFTLSVWGLVEWFGSGVVRLDILVAMRAVANGYWLHRCLRSASDVAVLESTTDDGRRALQLQDRGGPRRVTLEAIDAASGEVRLSEGASARVWMAIGSVDALARRYGRSSGMS